MMRMARVVTSRTPAVLSPAGALRPPALALTPVALALALTLAAGCGSTGRPASGPAAGSSPALTPGRQAVASLSDPDAGRTLQLRQGEVVSVVLHEATGFTPWSQLASSDGGVLAAVADPRAAAVRGVTLGSFQARSPGTARITSSASKDCAPGTPCPALARAWAVTVVVS